jgi:hypothetical protein
MQRGLRPSLEHEESNQHLKEDIGGGADNLEVNQGVQDAGMMKLRRRNTKKQQEGAPP